MGEVQDADALGRADVVDLAVRRGLLGEARQRSDRVRDVAEAAALRAVAVDLERTPGERGLHEARHDHPVLAALARPDGVEEPDDHAVEPALLVVGEREELVHRLRVRVGPAPLRRRPVDAARVLHEGHVVARVAVDLRGRRDEHPLAEAVAELEHGLGALDVRDQRVDGLLDDQPHADRGREVVDDVALVDELVDDRRREHRVDDEVEVRPLAQRRHVRDRARRQVVESVDLPASREQELAEMRADEAGAARDERLPRPRRLSHGGKPSAGVRRGPRTPA